MSRYSEGLAIRNASLVSVETPSTLKTRLDRDDLIFRQINADIFRAKATMAAEDFAAWKSWGTQWKKFYEDSEGWFDRLQGAIGGLVDQLEVWERDLDNWYTWAKSIGVKMTGPQPTSMAPSTFAKAAPWLLGFGAVATVAFIGIRYLKRGPEVTLRAGNDPKFLK